MRKLTLLFVFVLLAGAMVTPGFAQDGIPPHTECEVDGTGFTIQLISIGDLSGPFAPITYPIPLATDDYINYVNEQGGVCGAMLEQVSNDTGSDPAQTQAHYDRVTAEDPPVLLQLYASADSELLRQQLFEDEIPVLISAGSIEGLYGESGDEPGWIFATNPLYVDQLGTFCDWAGQNLENPRIGYISWEGAFGRAAYTPEAIAYCAEAGVEVLDSPEYFALGGTDASAQVQNLVDAGANILYTHSLATGPATIARHVVELGLEDEVRIAGANWVLDTSVGFLGQQTFGSDGLPSTNGFLASNPFLWWTETDQPGIQFVTELADANERPPQDRGVAYLLSVMNTDLSIELWIQTANRVGSFEAVTGPDMRETLETLEYNPLGLVNINYGSDSRDTVANRIGELMYLGEDGATPAGPDNPPLVVEGASGPVLIPIVVPLTDFADSPDLKPGGADAGA